MEKKQIEIESKRGNGCWQSVPVDCRGCDQDSCEGCPVIDDYDDPMD